MDDSRRSLPAVGKLLEDPGIASLADQHSREVVVLAVQNVISRARDGESVDDWTLVVKNEVETLTRPSLQRVINATGVVLHTNLGRAPLAREWFQDLAELATGYVNLEMDLSTGERGSRYDHCVAAFRVAVGAEDALVVNNNAAAVMLMLRGMAKGKEVVISRGELVEIGGTFRVPDILEVSGARLREVGTTNRTRAEDYARAIGPETGLLLKVHRSNFTMEGFVEEVEIAELVKIGKTHGVPVGYDAGSATLDDARILVATGVDAFCFSGDKLLGGPQSGIILGRAEWISRMKKEPWLRILRVGKVTLALLEKAVRNPSQSRIKQLLKRSIEQLREEADNIGGEIASDTRIFSVKTVETRAMAGGGSLPDEEFPSAAVRIEGEEKALNWLEKVLREGSPPVVARRSGGYILLDISTVLPEDRDVLVRVVRYAMQQVRG